MNANHSIVKVTSGKIFAPADYLKLGAELVVTSWYQRCLLVFTLDTWMVVALRLEDIAFSDTQTKMLRTLLLNTARVVTVGEEHSFPITSEQMWFAEIDHLAIWIPAKHYIELWSPDSFRQYCLIDWLCMEPMERDLQFFANQNLDWKDLEINYREDRSGEYIVPAFLKKAPDKKIPD